MAYIRASHLLIFFILDNIPFNVLYYIFMCYLSHNFSPLKKGDADNMVNVSKNSNKFQK